MKKLIRFLIIRLFIRNTDESIKIYHTLFSPSEIKSPSKSIVGTTKQFVDVKKPSTKKEELMESLNYLKNKQSKTKQGELPNH